MKKIFFLLVAGILWAAGAAMEIVLKDDRK
jgi:hypothetical protein